MFDKKRVNSELDRIAKDTVRALNNLFLNSTDANIMLDGLEEIRQLLDCLLLGTADYGLAVLRINNAKRFVASEEYGAAKYEVRMLSGGLRQQLGNRRCPSLPPHDQLFDPIVIPVF